MKIEYSKWFSPCLNQDMELKVYGHSGKPVIVFPCQGGRFYEFEDFGMIDASRGFIDSGIIQFYTVDSIDNQSWANWNAHPADRARRHNDFDAYVIHEVVPFIHSNNSHPGKLIATGCSMGAYHCANFFFRHPDIFDTTISLSGLLQLKMFIGDYSDENVYFNTPLSYLPNLDDQWYIDQYRESSIIVCVGQGAWEEPMLADAYALRRILEQKNIPHWIDIWGYDVNHDWPWWRQMLPYFLSRLNIETATNE